jgi:hypothetical protein
LFVIRVGGVGGSTNLEQSRRGCLGGGGGGVGANYHTSIIFSEFGVLSKNT